MFARLQQDPPVPVVLAGAAGVGKSRLAREIAERAEELGWATNIVVGTRAAASIPFGAVAPLMSESAADASPTELLARARQALTSRPDGSTHLLVVDDAQRLDAGTATLVHQVVVEGICRTVVTVRTGEPAPDAIGALWSAGLAERRELAALSRNQTGELLAVVLGGPVDGATRHRLWEASGGNVLYLRELVLGATSAGALREEAGIWRLRGAAGMPPRLVELIQRRLENLDPAARAALDVLAFAERMDLDQISRLADVAALERLEDEGLVEVAETSGEPLLVLTHPLYGEAVRATMPVLRRRRLCGAVADVIEAAGMTHPGDVVRVATWRLDARQPVDPELLTTASRRAHIANDYVLADRLATAARAAGAGVRAGLVLAESAMMTGRHEHAAELFAGLAAEALSDRERVKVAETRAIVLGLYLGREREALAVLDEVLAVVDDPQLTDPLRASLAVVLSQAPHAIAAIEAARPVLDRPESTRYWRATYAASIALAVCGRLDEALEVGKLGYEAHARLGVPVRYLAEAQFHGPVLALLGSGRAAEASDLVAKGYDASVAAHDVPLQSTFAMLAGLTALHRGRVVTAGQHFREAVATSREINNVPTLRWSLGGDALAAALRSDRAASAAALEELDALETPPRQLLDLDLVERSRAWASAAAGARTEAVLMLRAAASRAADTDQLVAEAVLRHDIARLGDARAEQRRLAELAERVDGELVPALADHARALASGAAEPLEAAANRLAGLGVAHLAYEAATGAAAAWRAGGHRRRAAACDELARRLETECEAARSPAARTEVGPVALTSREREVASLAADGLSSREIAEKLFLSPRTVDNHIQRIYDKLGVSKRQELEAALKR